MIFPAMKTSPPCLKNDSLTASVCLWKTCVRFWQKKHDVSVPQDDPILMQVTILQVFLEAQARLQKKHETALAAFMGQQTAAYVNDMEKNLKSLTETLSGLTMEGIRKAVADFAANLATHRSAMYLCTAIMALSALLNVAVFILGMVRHG